VGGQIKVLLESVPLELNSLLVLLQQQPMAQRLQLLLL
jgi:hypothetical protein